MERSFIATNESEYIKDLEKYRQLLNEQRVFVRKFLQEKGIKTNSYLVSGNGGFDTPFAEYNKKEIFLYIESTEQNKEFEKQLTKADYYGLNAFKRNSRIGKEFAQRCVDEKVIINVYQPSVGDYFDCLHMGGYSLTQFLHDDKLYIKITSDRLTDESPEGFTEIKLSEFHKAMEEYEKQEGEK